MFIYYVCIIYIYIYIYVNISHKLRDIYYIYIYIYIYICKYITQAEGQLRSKVHPQERIAPHSSNVPADALLTATFDSASALLRLTVHHIFTHCGQQCIRRNASPRTGRRQVSKRTACLKSYARPDTQRLAPLWLASRGFFVLLLLLF
jgi:hypothetical protein